MENNSFPLITKQSTVARERNGDAEGGNQDKDYDPFAARDVKNPTSDNETLVHLLKACLGSGILAMPYAFKNAGVLMGFISTFLVSFVCTYCSYILVKCAHTLYYRCRKSQMSFPEVAEAAFSTGPKWARKYTKFVGYLIKVCLFVTYFGAVSVYTVIIAKNFEHIVDDYLYHGLKLRDLIACLLIPLILLSWIPDLKYLAPFSMAANGFMAVSLAGIFYYTITEILKREGTPALAGNISDFPAFCSVTIFAIEAIGVMMPLENSMKNPRNFLGVFGVLNKGMFGATVVYAIVGALGYSAYLNNTEDSITVNFANGEIAADVVKAFIGLAVFITYGLQFYVVLEIMWNAIKNHFPNKPTLSNYILRTILVTCSVSLAYAVPTIGPFTELIGAVGFTILGLLVPVAIEVVTYWDSGFGPGNWMIIKNVIIVIIGIIAVVAGSSTAIKNIIKGISQK